MSNESAWQEYLVTSLKAGREREDDQRPDGHDGPRQKVETHSQGEVDIAAVGGLIKDMLRPYTIRDASSNLQVKFSIDCHQWASDRGFPAVPKILSRATDEVCHSVIMEKPYMDLRAFIKKRRGTLQLSEPMAVWILRELTGLLINLDEHGITHGSLTIDRVSLKPVQRADDVE
ncbi:unnamed protein product [Vitrella brassicaformis CCMP3155]|uniref:Protein kinase domain-containing protein n=1 Tax=Vitrella brassicaformis (strain CCMP3155) TaxID=1169540 RepID=A0A0G4EK77_VITBC|nr:unnamed protein product [Vitrella brassicaformis CCMP3155]|eukprot:CEL96821.1 unnamed protein product [Vitrella brassicaformis CCMP3155]